MPLSPDPRAEALRQQITRLFEGGDMSVVDEAFSPALVDHNPFPGMSPDREGIRGSVPMLRDAFPDMDYTSVNSIADGDKVLHQFEATGTHQGPFAGVPPTGKSVRFSAMVLARLDGDGRVAERWAQMNTFEVLQQLGVVPGGDQLAPWGSVPDVDPGRSTTPEENKEVMTRHVEEIWNQGNLDAADELFHPQSVTPHAPLPPGPMGVKVIAGMFRNAFPDFHMTIEDIIAEGALVGARFHQTGTHQGELFGIPPTGKPVAFDEIAVVQIADGKILSTWFETDIPTLMQQLGVGGAQ